MIQKSELVNHYVSKVLCLTQSSNNTSPINLSQLPNNTFGHSRVGKNCQLSFTTYYSLLQTYKIILFLCNSACSILCNLVIHIAFSLTSFPIQEVVISVLFLQLIEKGKGSYRVDAKKKTKKNIPLSFWYLCSYSV